MADLTTQDEPVSEAPTMDDTIAKEWERISKGVETTEGVADETPAEPTEKTVVRDEAGRFAGKEAAPELVETVEPVETVEQPAETRKPPSSLKKEAQEAWLKSERGEALTPQETKILTAEIERRENDFHKGMQPLKERARIADEMQQAMTPYQETISRLGATPVQVVSELLKVDHTIRYGSNEQVLALVADVMNRRGIPLDVFAQGMPQQVFQTAQQHNEMEQMRRQRLEMQARQESESLNSLNSEIARFSDGKEHWNAVQYELEAILRQIASDPQKSQLSPQEKLQEAYDRAVWANPQIRQSLIAKQQADEKAKAQEKLKNAKQAASVNVRSRGSMASSAPVGTIEDTIRAKAQELGLIN